MDRNYYNAIETSENLTRYRNYPVYGLRLGGWYGRNIDRRGKEWLTQ